MKKLLMIALLVPAMALAQEKTKVHFTVHEDQVKPGMRAEYEATLGELISLLKEHNIADANWLTSVTNDNRYWYVSPVENMADLDKSAFKTLNEKVGEDKMNDLWGRMDKCYDNHGTFMVTLDKELSYQPGGINQNPEGRNWREYHFWHYPAGNDEAVTAKAAEIKAALAAKTSPLHYRVYRSGFGVVGSYVLVAFAAPDAAAFHNTLKINRQLMGEEFEKLLDEFRDLCNSYEEVEGMIRNDLSYTPAPLAKE